MITIVDYGLSNIGSISNKLRMHGFNCTIAKNKQDIEKSTKIILPGVGHFKKAIENMKEKKILNAIIEKSKFLNTPILGICLGMQLLTEFSEEGNCKGLCLIPGQTKKFDKDLITPNVGWYFLETKADCFLLKEQKKDQNYYFTHSFYVDCKEEFLVSSSYNMNFKFPAVIRLGNVFGTQFHPEKSHESGFEIIKNFILYA